MGWQDTKADSLAVHTAETSMEQQAVFDKLLAFVEEALDGFLSTPMGGWSFGARPPLSELVHLQLTCPYPHEVKSNLEFGCPNSLNLRVRRKIDLVGHFFGGELRILE
jgi:hypothetical protein